MSFFNITYQIKRHVTIDADVHTVFALLRDFHEWQKWSPWMIMERGAKVMITGDGKSVGSISAWEGMFVGAGENQLDYIEENKELRYTLRFTKPFASVSETFFIIHQKGAQTEVEWGMSSALPFFLFFLRGMLEGMLGDDFDRGLKMLKTLAETGRVPSRIDDCGVSEIQACEYVGVRRITTKDRIASDMRSDFDHLMKVMRDKEVTLIDAPFSIVEKYDKKKDEIIYIACMPVSRDVLECFDGVEDLVQGSLEKTRAYNVRHVGAYDFLDNAWTAVYVYVKTQKYQSRKGFSPVEIYRNNPQETKSEDLITDIYVPIV